MNKSNRWLLPAGIVELLPEQAEPLERVRRGVVDLFHSWGYELVMPPFLEFMDSLGAAGEDLDLRTFKVTDQLSGRMMGLRTDMTPQVARIDAHHLNRDIPVRLCYLGTVLHTVPDGFGASRTPLQVGAELYGHRGIASDLEIVRLMVAMLAHTGLDELYLDLGHVGIYRQLARQAELSPEQEAKLFDALQRKARTEIEDLLDSFLLADDHRDMLSALMDLNGDEQVLQRAARILAAGGKLIAAALQDLSELAAHLHATLPDLKINFDLAELRGYQYQTGVVFAAYAPGYGREVARGGRYDHIGEAFGRARPATGFSADLKVVMELSRHRAAAVEAIFAPGDDDRALQDRISELRGQGLRVICALPGLDLDARAMGCSRQLVQRDGEWHLVGV